MKNNKKESLINNQKIISDIEEAFDKKFTYLIGGTLSISLAFIKDIVSITSSINKYWLIIGWSVLGFTLLFNVFNLLFSRKYFIKIQKEINSNISDIDINNKINKLNLTLEILDWISYGLFFIGLSSILIFLNINI